MYLADVYLWNTRIGTVYQESLTSLPSFNYHKDFLESGINLSPIVMPLNARRYEFPMLNQESFYGLPGLLADSLPDKFGTTVLNEYLQRQGRNIENISAIERLLYTGSRGMGALEYRPAMEIGNAKSVPLDIDELVQIASDILTKRSSMALTESEHLMEQIMDVGSSAGGARAKAVIAWNQKTKSIKSGQVKAGKDYEYWLIKFDNVKNNKDHEVEEDRREYTRIEYAYYLMATACGIIMNPCQLYEENGYYHFMTKRFDRTESGDKIHMQTFGALEHLDYKSPGASSYENAYNTLRSLELGQSDAEQLFRRMVFNDTYINYDDHVKNISFLMTRDGNWHLAPAYDITYSYKADSFWVSQHQMKINGKQKNISYDDFLETASYMNIKVSKAKRIIDEVFNSKFAWETYAEKACLTEEVMEELKKKFK